MKKVVMVVAAHPDDEVLGCGGSIIKHVESGDEVYVVFMSDGVTSRKGSHSDKIIKRKEYASNAAEILGVKSLFFLDFPDNRMDSIALLDVVQPLEDIISHIRPSVVYTHYSNDLNIDHQVTNKAVMIACRPIPNFCVKEIYAFEVLSSTGWSSLSASVNFSPNLFIDITKSLNNKIKALSAYQGEVMLFPHCRSVDSVKFLAKYRGSSVGIDSVEAFFIERLIREK